MRSFYTELNHGTVEGEIPVEQPPVMPSAFPGLLLDDYAAMLNQHVHSGVIFA